MVSQANQVQMHKHQDMIGVNRNEVQTNRHQDTVIHVNIGRSERFQADEFALVNKEKYVESVPLITQPTFTPKQYNTIMHMLCKKEASSSLGGALDMANMAGMLVPSTLSVANRETLNTKVGSWIVDSGATYHMTSKLKMLNYASSCNGRMVHLPNGEVTFLICWSVHYN